MSPERHQATMDILAAALDCPRKERAELLERLCAGDESLRRAVEDLLSHQDSAALFLEDSVLAAADRVADDRHASLIGRTLGAYRVIEAIGRGGMGAVYLAERSDDAYHRRVAIKVIKRGMDTDAIQRRFLRERQILANLDHHHIARLFDGGAAPDGRPYLVMEYVAGLPIDRYADERGLDEAGRLTLFLKVCQAVQHAHRHHVVHGDIKPANILVTEEGVPKLLDFGVARIVNPVPHAPDAPTGSWQALTPDYASPEQLRGEPITAVSDVYSLGAVLHDLLAGRRSRQSTDGGRRRPLKGDLGNVVTMALRDEPGRRYATVAELAGDLARYVDGQPVQARKDTIGYRAGTFVRRHRRTVMTSAAIAVACLLLGVLVTWLAIRAPGGESRAPRRDTQNEMAYRDYVMGRKFWNLRTYDSIPVAIEYFQRAIAADPQYALAYSGLADSYGLIGAYYLKPAHEAFPPARAAALKALTLDDKLAAAHTSLALTLWLYEWDWPKADEEFRRAIALDPRYVTAHHWYGLFLGEMARFDEALAQMQKARELDPTSAPVVADSGRVYFWARRYEDSHKHYKRAFDMGANFSFLYEAMELYEQTDPDEYYRDLVKLQSHADPNIYRTQGPEAFWRRDLATIPLENPPPAGVFRRVEDLARLGERDRAFQAMEVAIQSRDHRMTQLKVDPILDPLRSDSRFAEFLGRMNLSR